MPHDTRRHLHDTTTVLHQDIWVDEAASLDDWLDRVYQTQSILNSIEQRYYLDRIVLIPHTRTATDSDLLL